MNEFINYANELIKNNDMYYEDNLRDITISQSGGDVINKNDSLQPTGGFPPIYICKKKNNMSVFVQETEKPRREYKQHKIGISIKDIIKQRKNTKPLLSLRQMKQLRKEI